MTNEHDRRIAAMFDRIAPRYDLLNRVLSFGVDIGWRRRALALLEPRATDLVLDLGAGTGDLSRATAARGARVVAVDLSCAMLGLLRRRGLRRVLPVIASGEDLPLGDASVDRAISGFTIRNVGDLPRTLRELRRVLRAGGRVVLLELSRPPSAFGRIYSFYLERALPPLAAALGGDAGAYRYLPRSVRAFPSPERVAELLREAGFREVRCERLSLGIATIHTASI